MLARDQATDYVNKFTLSGAVFAAIPIPGTSIALTAAESTMVITIGKTYGLEMEKNIIIKIFPMIMGAIGGSAMLKSAAEVLAIIPVIGWIAKPVVAGTAMKLFGEAAIAYFESKFPDKTADTPPTFEELVVAFGFDIAREYADDVFT